MKSFDVAVLGAGGMGSAACLHLAEAGLRVLGVEQFSIPNTRGSSHGSTRILRLGLHESAKYVPLVMRAMELTSHFDLEPFRLGRFAEGPSKK
ncbi:MAG: FAD-dependent oxidoreductase [Chthoniobacterales bacterium]